MLHRCLARSIAVIGPLLFCGSLRASPSPPSSAAPAKSAVAVSASASAPATSAVALSSVAPASAATSSSGAVPDDAEDQYYFTAHKVRPRFSLATLMAIGPLPAPSFGGQAGVGFQWRHFSLSVEGRALLSSNFDLSKDRSAFAGMVLGMLTPCAHGAITRPLYSFDLCAWVGAGRVFIQPDTDVGKPLIQGDQVHPFTIMTGIRPLVSWQFAPSAAPEFLLKPFMELNMGALRLRYSYNGKAIFDGIPWGFIVGVEVGAVLGQPAKWNKPLMKDPEVARGY